MSPSKLALFEQCPLHYLLESEGATEGRLGASPALLLGMAVHRAVEARDGKKAGLSVHEARAKIEEEVRLLASSGKPSMAVVRYVLGRAGITALIPFRHLLTQAQFAHGLSVRYRFDAYGTVGRSTVDSIPIGRERWLESTRAGIGGVVDFIDRLSDGTVRIADFKTGRLTDDGGMVRRAYLLQMEAYAEAVMEIEPSAKVRLELAGREEDWSALYDMAMRADVRAVLARVAAVLPFGATVSHADVAVLGDHCKKCSSRPACPRYGDLLEQQGASEIREPFATLYDVAGEVLGSMETDGLVSIQCRLHNGLVAKIANIPSDLLKGLHLQLGARFTAFALASLEAGNRGNPQNFYVVSPSSLKECAFRAVFRMRAAIPS